MSGQAEALDVQQLQSSLTASTQRLSSLEATIEQLSHDLKAGLCAQRHWLAKSNPLSSGRCAAPRWRVWGLHGRIRQPAIPAAAVSGAALLPCPAQNPTCSTCGLSQRSLAGCKPLLQSALQEACLGLPRP